MRHLPTGTVYVVFTGMGAVGTALLGLFWHGEPASVMRIVGLATILVGVTVLYLGDVTADSSDGDQRHGQSSEHQTQTLRSMDPLLEEYDGEDNGQRRI